MSDSTPRPELEPEPEEPKSALPSFPYTPTSAERDGLGPLQSSDLPAPASMQEPAAEAPMELEPGLVLAPSNASEVAAPPPLPKKRTASKVEEVAKETTPEAETPGVEKSPLDIAPADWEAMLPQPPSNSSGLDAAVVDAEELIEVDTDDFVEIQSEEPEEIASAEVIESVALSDAHAQPEALPSFESPAPPKPVASQSPSPPHKVAELPEAELPKLEPPAALANLARPTPAPTAAPPTAPTTDGDASIPSDIPSLAIGDLQPPSSPPDAFPPPPDSEDEMLASLMADLEIAEPPKPTPQPAHAMAPLDENEVVLLDRPKRKTQDLPQPDPHPSGPSAPAFTPPPRATPTPIRTITGTPISPNAAGSAAHAPAAQAQSSSPQVPAAPVVVAPSVVPSVPSVPSGSRAPVAPQTVVPDSSDPAPRMRPTIRARPVKERDRRAEILRDQANPHPEAEQYYQLALQALKTQAFEDAEQLLRKALVRSPSNPKITRALDKLKRMLGTP